jgi:FkbM family methyltransferase
MKFQTASHGGRDWLIPARDAPHVIARRFQQGDQAIGMLASICQLTGVAVQAGGNWGYWPWRFTELFGTVYTFEPDAACFVALASNTGACRNIIRIQAALGADPALVDLERDTDTTGNQHIKPGGIYPTLRIDDLGLPVCDLIYLDIEGMELEALRGAEQTIARCKPIVVFEEAPKLSPERKAAALMEDIHRYQRIGQIGRDLVMAP